MDEDFLSSTTKDVSVSIELNRTFRSLLNKITADNFDHLSQQACRIDNIDNMQSLISVSILKNIVLNHVN
jgi:hypothetical protein